MRAVVANMGGLLDPGPGIPDNPIPAPNNFFEQDFVNAAPVGTYNLQGDEPPLLQNGGPGGSPSSYHRIPSGTADGQGNPRSEYSWLSNTGFGEGQTDYGLNFGGEMICKLQDVGNERGQIMQTHASSGALAGNSPRFAIQVDGADNVYEVRVDGFDGVHPTIPGILPSDTYNKYVYWLWDFRENHGNRNVATDVGSAVPGLTRLGFWAIYATVGTESVIPPRPVASDLLIRQDDIYLGTLDQVDSSLAFYQKSGLYFRSKSLSSIIEMEMTKFRVQDQVLLTADQV